MIPDEAVEAAAHDSNLGGEIMGEDKIRQELERVSTIRDSFEPGTPVWLINQGMALAYETVLNDPDAVARG